MKRLAVILSMLMFAMPVLAVQPDEILDDPKLEQRARDISAGLRCLVCRNENIDESNAELARDLRLLVRERLLEGDSNEEVVDYIVARYGEYVLLKPTMTGGNWLLWGAGPLMLLFALGAGVVYLRGRARATEPGLNELSEAERKRLREILDE